MWPGQNVFFENSVEYSKCKACCQNYQERDNGDYQAKKLHPISTYAYYEQVINKYQSKQGCEIKIRDRCAGIRLGSLVNQNTAIVNDHSCQNSKLYGNKRARSVKTFQVFYPCIYIGYSVVVHTHINLGIDWIRKQ